MKSDPVEEKYPLLLLYVEENGRKSDFPQRVVFTDKGRGKGVIDGAATIITQWPAQVSSCWLTSVVIAFIFVFLTFALFMTSLNPIHSMHPRCTRDLKNYHGSNVIHLVKQGIEWNAKQLDILKFIAETFPKYEINNIIVDISKKELQPQNIKNTTRVTSSSAPTPTPSTTPNSSLAMSAQHRKNGLLFPEITSIFFRKFNEIIARDRELFHKANNNQEEKEFLFIPELVNLKRFKREETTYAALLTNYKNIKERKVPFKEYFVHTPLAYYWADLNADMVILAVRVQELWQNGGISFLLPGNESGDLAALKATIANTKYKFEILPNDSVSVDGRAWHMATRTPCRTFFGDMLMRMQKNTEKLTVSTFVADTLDAFCRRGAIDSDYCKRTQIK